MERIAFLIEATGSRITCQLNPESFVIRRTVGAQPRRSLTGQISGAGLTDEPLLLTGGGRTELEFELLFDVSLVESGQAVENVRDLTQPLWNLAENAATPAGYRQPPIARFIWGKSWNVPGVVTAIAERLEQFTPSGAPQRSWLHLKFVRINEPKAQNASLSRSRASAASSSLSLAFTTTALDRSRPAPAEGVTLHEVIGATGESSTAASAEGEAQRRSGAAAGDVGGQAAPVPTGAMLAQASSSVALPSSAVAGGEQSASRAEEASAAAPADTTAGERNAADAAPGGEGGAGETRSADEQTSQGTTDAPQRGLLARLRRRRKSGAVPTPSGAITTAEAAAGASAAGSGGATADGEDASAAFPPAPGRVAEHPLVQRLDEIAARYYGDPTLWRLVAYYNRLDDPLHVRPGTALQIPPLNVLGGLV
jgi:hypothetical protein